MQCKADEYHCDYDADTGYRKCYTMEQLCDGVSHCLDEQDEDPQNCPIPINVSYVATVTTNDIKLLIWNVLNSVQILVKTISNCSYNMNTTYGRNRNFVKK